MGREKHQELKDPKERHDSYRISSGPLTNVYCNVTRKGLNKAELKVGVSALKASVTRLGRTEKGLRRVGGWAGRALIGRGVARLVTRPLLRPGFSNPRAGGGTVWARDWALDGVA